MKISVLLFFMLSAQLAFGQNVHKLSVNITGIKTQKGKIGVCLITEKKEFLSDCSDYKEYEVKGSTLSFERSDISPNVYAITIYHDANNNGELDTNFLGLPKERYGFSNNPRTTFGPPSFQKCLFEIRSDTSIEIKLK